MPKYEPAPHCCDHPKHYYAAMPLTIEQFLGHIESSGYDPQLTKMLFEDVCRRIIALEKGESNA